MSKLFKKDEKFFKIFGQMTVYILEAAEILGSMLRNPTADLAPLAAKIKDIEHKGDELTHRVIDELNKTFITPIDREDIHDLSAALDDVLDLIDNTATRIVLFRITEPIRAVPEMCAVLLSQVMEMGAAVSNLQDNDHVVERCIEINRLENLADDVLAHAITDLFKGGDAITIIKYKDIYQMLEMATDKCEDAANVLSDIAIRHS